MHPLPAFIRHGLMLLILLHAMPAWAAVDSRVIELQHQPYEEIAPLIRPLLGSSEAMSGRDFRMILQAAPDRLETLIAHVRVLDHPRPDLLVDVHLGRLDESRGMVRHHGTQRQSRQSLRVADGQPARIVVLQTRQVAEPQILITPWGSQVGIGYRDRDSGQWLAVRPRLVREQVRLEIAPGQIEDRGRTEQRFQAETTVTVDLGEWVPLATTQDGRQREARPLTRHHGTRQDAQIWVRVTRAEP